MIMAAANVHQNVHTTNVLDSQDWGLLPFSVTLLLVTTQVHRIGSAFTVVTTVVVKRVNMSQYVPVPIHTRFLWNRADKCHTTHE